MTLSMASDWKLIMMARSFKDFMIKGRSRGKVFIVGRMGILIVLGGFIYIFFKSSSYEGDWE